MTDTKSTKPEPASAPDPAPLSQGRCLMADLALALSVLTRLPVSGHWFAPAGQDRTLSQALWAFPLIGVIIGSIGGIGLLAASAFGLHPMTCALIAVGLMVLATGALHEDGLADVTDGFGGGRTPAQKLDVMKDSRIGSYGVLALIIGVGLKVTALSTLLGPGMAAAAVVAAAALSRAAIGPVMLALDPARKDGLGQMAGKPTTSQVLIALGLALVIVLICTPLKTGLLGFVIALAGVAFLVVLAQRQIQGFTGDVLGTAQVTAEVLFLLVAAGTSQWF